MADDESLADVRAAANEAVTVIRQASKEGQPEPIVEAIGALSRALVADGDRRGRYLMNIGSACMELYGIVGGEEPLYKALIAYRAALAAEPGSAINASNLGICLVRWFERTGELDSLAEAIDVLRLAVDAGKDRPASAGYSSNLGLALTRWAEQTGDADAAREAVVVHAAAVRRAPDAAADQAAMLSNLGMARMAVYRLTAEADELGLAVEAYSAAVRTVPAEDPNMPGCLAGLGGALTALAAAAGTVRPRIDAIEALRIAVRSLPREHPDRPMFLGQLGGSLQLAFLHSGDTAALREAVACGREAAELAPEGHRDRKVYRAGLAVLLRNQYEYTGDVAALEEARSLLAGVLSDESWDRRDRLKWKGDLSSVLHRLGRRHRSVPRLAEGAALLREVLEEIDPGDPELVMYLGNLGSLLGSLIDIEWDRALYLEAVEALERVVRFRLSEGTSDSHFNLGTLYQSAYQHDGSPEAYEQAAAAFSAAASEPRISPRTRATAAHYLGRLHLGAGRPDAALVGYEQALDLMDLVAWQGLAREDQERGLADFAGLASAAAACALAIDAPDRALAVLEQGRGVLIGQVLESRSRHEELAGREAELALELEAAQNAIDQAEESESPTLDRQRLLVRRDEVLDRIRSRPGFDRFLRSPDPAGLRSAVGDGPVVTLNISPSRCDALVTTRESTGSVELPDLTSSDAVTQANRFLEAVNANGWGTNDVIREALAWLWETTVAPVLDHLGFGPAESARLPRLWWVPTGALSVLPIHAAGHHGRADGDARSALHRVVSSYTPSLRMLRHSQDRAGVPGASSPSPSPSPSLVVAVGAGGVPLVHAEAETEAVAALLPGQVLRLTDQQATKQDVVDAIVRSGWVHFACHATTDAVRPTEGCLHLYDGDLRIREITGLRVPHAEAVYLSACTTALGSRQLPDETIHISSAFQQIGFPTVIGTLWQVPDQAAARTAQKIYAALPGISPAYAVNHVARSIRAEYPNTPYDWAAFVHSGSL
ncbi:CHAT domain-containing protein [Catenulispora yoronensis]|uniref:CHAT domain-containing protein n=1 Tax=Catenulispora yoronensis TaxID=450799 RepID=A0ABN2UPH8_9ACTN